MTLASRIIPCLDIMDGRVVKGVQFVALRDAGSPIETARQYDADGADELVFLDIAATHTNRDILPNLVRQVAAEITIPFTVGGGVRSIEDFSQLLRAGADKVSVNSAAVARPKLISECAMHFGAQCVVLAADVKRTSPTTWEVVTHGGRRKTNKDAITWLKEAVDLGAGEILLTSMDADGTRDGYDTDLLQAAAAAVNVPLIASGGGGNATDMEAALRCGADAVLAASIFHDGIYRISEIKKQLAERGVTVRLN